jgi:hypothetical protein
MSLDSVRYGGRVLVQELSDVLELHRLLADVANPDDERDRLAVVVGSMFTGVMNDSYTSRPTTTRIPDPL